MFELTDLVLTIPGWVLRTLVAIGAMGVTFLAFCGAVTLYSILRWDFRWRR